MSQARVSTGRRTRWTAVAWVGIAAAAAVTAWWAWDRYRPLPAPTAGDAARGASEFFDSDLGSARWSAVPTVLFDAMPEIFPDLMPEGWEGVGLFWRTQDHSGPPVGTAKVRILGLDAYAPNCAICHAGRFDGKVVSGMPNENLDIQLLTHSFQTGLESGRLTVDAVAAVAAKHGHPMGPIDRVVLGFVLGQAKAAFERGAQGWYHDAVGPGRSDALAGWKRRLGVRDEPAVTWVDLPPIFNQRLKDKTLYDGSITGDMATRVMLTELQKGRPFRDPLIHREVFDDLVAWMKVLDPPKYPFAVDRALASRGRTLFEAGCSRCHGTYGDSPTYPNKRIDISRVGTDDERARAMTQGVVTALHTTAKVYEPFLTIDPRPTYMPPALNGLYLTSPYLHDGSVPTLWHLLQPSEKRPRAFYRRWNEFDPKRVGIVCSEVQVPDGVECAPDATQQKHDPRTVWRFDARKVGNRNTGHEFGTDLSDDEKAALIEYLKTI
jgi:mono/diheme cytochrome c family protein